MSIRGATLACSALALTWAAWAPPPALAGPEAPGRVDYNRDVRPILSDRCYSCHGPDEAQRQAGLRLDTETGALGQLASGGRAVVRGTPEASVLLERIASDDPTRRMPPAYMGHDPIPNSEIGVLREWIEHGAVWAEHWAFAPPRKISVPDLGNGSQGHDAIDALVLRRLEAEGLTLAPPAEPRTLARRAALDLTGLPLAPETVEEFATNASPDAYEKFLDSLLASPRYGEHLAAMWLDAARYADTNGYQTDGVRSMWRWRDWVIEAFNRNLSFDRFTIEQLAGDMLPGATRDQVIASGFNRNHRTTAEGGSVNEEFRVEYVADRAETTATVWLGMTLACARCHDHKFDPLSQKEYYQFFAYFNNVPEKGMVWNFGNEDPLVLAPTPEQEAQLSVLESDATTAAGRWDAMASRVAAEQAEWERGLAASPEGDWAPQRGLSAYAGLDGRLEIRSFSGGSIDGSEEPQPVDTVFGQGRIGAAAVFDGTKYADLGKLGDSDYLDPISVSAWIWPETSADSAIVSSMGENPIGAGWGLFVRGGKLWWHMSRRWSDLSLRIETRRDIVAGRWQHVLLTYDGKRKARGVRMYLDGEHQDLSVLFDNLDWPSKSNATLKIGGGGGLDNRFAGRIDEVRIYARELSPGEARALASARELAALALIPGAERTPPQRDKLRQAFLDSGASREVRRALYAAREAQRRVEEFRSEIPTVMVMKEGADRKAYVLDRGRYDARGEVVSPGVPEAIRNGLTTDVNDRLALAQWIASRSNPLTARVIVNRFWQMLFGVGIVKTVDDFGSQGEAPSNQALLDWLAIEFMESGWDVKQLLKTIMSSSTYRQSSRASPALRERDPENRLLARGPRFRLPAATIRDQALAASGLLAGALGGPSVKPYQPPGLWKEVSGQVYEPGSGPDLYRRSLYTYWKRTVAPPSMMNFDASDREVCTVHVKRTNTPLQALNTMNDPTFVEAARNLAESVLRGRALGREERIEATYRSVLSRPPRPTESDALEALLQSYLDEFSADPEAAEQLLEVGDSSWDGDLDAGELAAYTGVASLVLNLDEAVTKQ